MEKIWIWDKHPGSATLHFRLIKVPVILLLTTVAPHLLYRYLPYLREAIPEGGGLVNMKTLTVAMSGCVSVVAHVDGPHLHVASTGDCSLSIFV
jgi:hypothetical protein